jgi:hypothetical protein
MLAHKIPVPALLPLADIESIPPGDPGARIVPTTMGVVSMVDPLKWNARRSSPSAHR